MKPQLIMQLALWPVAMFVPSETKTKKKVINKILAVMIVLCACVCEAYIFMCKIIILCVCERECKYSTLPKDRTDLPNDA